MKRSILMVATCALLLGTMSCKPPDYNEYSTLEELCEAAEHNERVKVSGVLKLPGAVIEHDNRYRVLLVMDINQDQPAMTPMIKEGKSKNRMQTLPESYTYADFVVQTADGRTVGHGDAVTISGQYLSGCLMSADVIE